MINNLNNYSDCFEHMKNNEKFKKDIKNYTLEHRKRKIEYNPDKYYLKDSASEIYYSHMYNSEGSSIIRERPFSADIENKAKYAYNRKYLKSEIRELNDCGVDKKRIQENKNKGLLTERKIYPKKIILNIKDKNNNIKKFNAYKKLSPHTACKLNKRVNLISHIFPENEKIIKINKIKKNMENLKSKNNEKKIFNYGDEYYHLGNSKNNIDLPSYDPNIWGSIHSKWTKSKIDWESIETELMFGNTFNQEMLKNYGPKGPNAFQRKMIQLADSHNKDTITEIKKENIPNIKKPLSQKNINNTEFKKIEDAINEIPNLKIDKKNKIKINATTAILNGEQNMNKKIKSLKKYYTNNINKVQVNKKENKEKNWNNFSKYELIYPIKGEFEKFDENDIKLIFRKKELHIYDIQKNHFDKGIINSVQFKVSENEEEKNIVNKINEVKKDLEKKNYKVLIKKKEKKDVRKKIKNIVNNKGEIIGIINDNIENKNNDKNKFKIMPDKLRNMHSFSKGFLNINYKYKNFHKDL